MNRLRRLAGVRSGRQSIEQAVDLGAHVLRIGGDVLDGVQRVEVGVEVVSDAVGHELIPDFLSSKLRVEVAVSLDVLHRALREMVGLRLD